MRERSILSVLAVAVVLAGGARAARAVAPPTVESILNSYRAKGVTDAEVLIASNGVPVFGEALGLADRERGVRNTRDTEFRIGSITKQFTALAVLQLVQARKPVPRRSDLPVHRPLPARLGRGHRAACR